MYALKLIIFVTLLLCCLYFLNDKAEDKIDDLEYYLRRHGYFD